MKKSINQISKSKLIFLFAATISSISQTVFADQNNTTGSGDLLKDVLALVEKFAVIGGGLWAVWGVIVLAGGLKDKNGPALQSGIWQIVGGAMIIAAAATFKTLVK